MPWHNTTKKEFSLCKLQYKINQRIRGKRKEHLHNDAVPPKSSLPGLYIYYVGFVSFSFLHPNKKNSQLLIFNIRICNIDDSFEVELLPKLIQILGKLIQIWQKWNRVKLNMKAIRHEWQILNNALDKLKGIFPKSSKNLTFCNNIKKKKKLPKATHRRHIAVAY